MRRKFIYYVHLSTNWNSICNMTVIGWKMTRRLEFLPYDGKEADVLGRTFTYFVATTTQWVQNIYGVQHYLWSTTLHSIKIGVHITKQEFKNDVFKAFDFSTTLI